MTQELPFGSPQNDAPDALPPKGANAPAELSVSELSQKLKRMVEGTFGYVRVRGELSKVTLARSGHLYTALKDENAVLDAVCWKGTVTRLSVRPEEGLDVVCTGRLTTYPGRSNYQLVIESMELAGEGALLKMLEERRRKLAAEGLFDPARKKPLPFLPETIGVITSPTGAVIRDILHRLADRFPRRVLLWPVQVQGERAAAEVAAAIRGFNALPENSPHRPQLLIVARGGGSLEDLMPFNDEAVVRAAAESAIPLISAVGHETDTTLIDHAADLRAPTPTAAAEKAVPVRTELLAHVLEAEQRLLRAITRLLAEQRLKITALARGLGDPQKILETLRQKLDHAGTRLDMSLRHWLARKEGALRETGGRLSLQPVQRKIADDARFLARMETALGTAFGNRLSRRQARLQALSALLESLSFENVLSRGYALVLDAGGRPVTGAQKAIDAKSVTLRFHDGAAQAEVSGPDQPVEDRTR